MIDGDELKAIPFERLFTFRERKPEESHWNGIKEWSQEQCVPENS